MIHDYQVVRRYAAQSPEVKQMLAALEAVEEWLEAINRNMPVVTKAIAAAKAAGIKAEG